MAGFPKTLLLSFSSLLQSITPDRTRSGLGSFPFARRYSENRCFFLFLRVLRCFSSPGSLPYVMYWRMDDWGLLSRVSPFRNLRITEYLLLPAAYRSLSRLSSALSAKASTLRPYQLDLIKNFVLVRCIALHLFFFACQLILQNYLAWMSDKSYLYDLFFYMQFSRYHQIKSIRFYLLQVASQLVLYTTLWRSNLNQCFATCAVHYAVKIRSDVHFVAFWLMLDQSSMIRMLSYHASLIQRYFLFNWRPPTLPCRLQHSTIGRLGLNHRVRDGNGCYP